MDALGSLIVGEIVKAFSAGDPLKFGAYILIFFVLWLEMRSLKKAVKSLSDTIAKSFADGEKRFHALESNDKDFEHRLTLLEKNKNSVVGELHAESL